jgi:hypothetical protein
MRTVGLAFSRASRERETRARQAQYKFKGTPFPKDGNAQQQAEWHNVNAPDDVKVGHTVHELGHVIALRESGIGHQGMILGTHPNPRRDGVVHGMTLLPRSMFLSDGTLDPEHLAAFIDITVSGAAAEKEILGQDSEGLQSDLTIATTELIKSGRTLKQAQDYVTKSYERQREVFRSPAIKQEVENAVPFLVRNHHVGKLVVRDTIDKCLAGVFQSKKEE